MKVVDVFRFQSGRTVFVGETAEPEFIGPCLCELVVDGVRTATFRLEGEMFHPSATSGLRSITTAEQIDIEIARSSRVLRELRGLGG